MSAATDSEWAPWYLVQSNDKRRARLNLLSHLLSQIPYEPLVASDVELPDRRVDASQPRGPRRWIRTSSCTATTSAARASTSSATCSPF